MKTIPIITIVLILFSCNAQEKNKKTTTQKQTEMTTEKFDIATFNKNQGNGKYNFILKDGTKIEQEIDKEFYNETIRPPLPILFISDKRYYKSGNLQSELIHFPNRFLKNLKKYDENGKLTEEIDYDKPFKFNFEQLLKLIKKEKDTINLFDKNTSIGRLSDTTGTFWYITYKKTSMRRERLKVDGITGEILERSHYLHKDN